MSNNIVYTNLVDSELQQWLSDNRFDRVFVLMDTNTRECARPLIQQTLSRFDAAEIILPPEDENKNIESLMYIWEQLSTGGASRHSVLVNLGGGMITDIGGFAASSFKRGIAYINIPTTLLAMVDAAIGGKTGINFNGLKNEIGAFYSPALTIFDMAFLRTLDKTNLYSGYAEMIKHGLISSLEYWSSLMSHDLTSLDGLELLVKASIDVKSNVIEQDPCEKGLRKILNFGHTFGHAIESYLLKAETPVLHGYAVAWGMVGELYVSCKRYGFPTDVFEQTASFIRNHYGLCPIPEEHTDEIYQLLLHDKKNKNGQINCVLLRDIGQYELDQLLSLEDVREMIIECRKS